MSTADAWRYAANDGAHRPDDGWSQRTRFAFSDIVTLLWAQRWLMAGIFISITALGLAYAMTLKNEYTANASIFVKLGQEYVYQPRAGDAGRGAVPNNDAVVASELDILQSAGLHQRAVERIGIPALFPKMKTGRTAAERADATAKAVAALGKGLDYGTAPDMPTIRLSYKSDNPEMAARVLNVLMEEYLTYRRGILGNANGPAIQTQKATTQQQLDAINAAYEAFLTFNHIGDFDGDKTSLTQVLNNTEQQRYTLEASVQEAQGRLTSVTNQLAAMPKEVTSYRDQNLAGQAQLDTLIQRRTQALATYLPTSDIVRNLDQQIADLQKAQSEAPAAGDAARRIAANPNYQTAESDRITAQAQVNGLRASLAAVNKQVDDVNGRLQELAGLEPEYRRLASERGILQDSVANLSRQEEENSTSDAIAQASPDNIRIVSRATPPTQGSSKRKLVAMLAIALAAFTALCAGLLTIFLKPGLPTAVAAGRTLDLPVLATARVKR